MSEIINNTFQVDVPEGMHLLTGEEKAAFYGKRMPRGEENWVLRNEEKHTVIDISWKKRPRFLGRAASLEKQRDATEKKIALLIPSYEKLGHGEKTVDGEKFCTFRCAYTAGDKKQYGEYDLCIRGDWFYGIQCIYQGGYGEYAEKEFEELLASLKFI